MDEPKQVIKKEPKKSLFVLFAAALFSLIIGIVLLVGLGSGEAAMGQGAGWIMIAVGVICLGFYVFGRRSGKS